MDNSKIVFGIAILVAFIGLASSAMKLCSETSTKDKLCQMNQDYFHNEPPKPHPAEVEVVVDVYDISEINEELQTLTLFADIIISWTDPEVSVSSDSMME